MAAMPEAGYSSFAPDYWHHIPKLTEPLKHNPTLGSAALTLVRGHTGPLQLTTVSLQQKHQLPKV